jgi:hypothetical protein
MFEKRTFARHGRGELVRTVLFEGASTDKFGGFQAVGEGLKIVGEVKQGKTSSKESTNAVGLLVELENVSKDDVSVHLPNLVKGGKADVELTFKAVRPLADFYKQIPRTTGKLYRGEPLHIVALGSSVDHGDANPPLYLYDEDPKSATFKRPVVDVESSPMAKLGKAEWADYVAQTSSRFVYTGRLRLDLMQRYDYPIDRILLNLTAGGGSSIGEAHAGYAEFGDLVTKPAPHNGHTAKKTWQQLYPALFERTNGPRPDLIIFGHGENEHVDGPEEAGVFEATIRLFQRRYPGVECVFTIWPRDGKAVHDATKLKALAAHYGIPYIDIEPTVKGLYKTCNSYAICPDGGHPQAGWHYIWSRMLAQAFEGTGPVDDAPPQKQLPKRWSEHAYLWEGDAVTYSAGSPRIRTSRVVLDDSAFILWGGNKDANRKLGILIDGQERKDCGSGYAWGKRTLWNSSFVHGRLSLGDRHVVEVTGEEAAIVAVDCKVPPGKTWIDAASERWVKPKASEVGDFASQWGAPFGAKKFELRAGEAAEIEAEGTDFALAYVDAADGGTLRVTVDGREVLVQETNLPFVDSEKKEHWMENRRGIREVGFGKHKVRVEAVGGKIIVLGLASYDRRSGTPGN